MCGRRSGTPDPALRVLYDGGPLAYAPGGSAALHLLEILENLPESIEPWIAMPEEVKSFPISDRLHVLIEPMQEQLRWEQATLPALIGQAKAGLVHLTSLRAPFFSPAPCMISPAEPFGITANSGILSRLGESLGRGGFSRARLVLWPADLPEPEWNTAGVRIPIIRLPPMVHSAFYRQQQLPAGLPDTYVFCPGPLAEKDLPRLVDAWRFAGAGFGENFTLLVEGLTSGVLNRLTIQINLAGIDSPVQSVCLPDPTARAAVIQHAAEILCLGPVLPWGDSLLHALACERPLAAIETPYSDARVGPAGYLAPPGDARALGAAIITPLVEETVQEQLMAAAHSRAAAWQSDQFSAELEKAYLRAIKT